MTVTDLYRKLDATSKSQLLKTWGALSMHGFIVLRVWEDEFERINGTPFALILNPSKAARNEEREEHVEMIRHGTKACAVMNKRPHPGASATSISKDAFICGGLVEQGDQVWIELVERVSLDEVKKRLS